MYIIGLTGNIATGKSTVARMLDHLGATVIDADRVAHWVMRAGSPVNDRIVDRFGVAVRLESGEIDRRALGSVVFADAAALRDLEDIVHPETVAETWRRLQAGCRVAEQGSACDRPVAVVEAVKLLEASMHERCASVWVVNCSRARQVARLMETRGLSRDEANLRIDAQRPAEWLLARADVVIENDHDLQATWRQVTEAWNKIPGVAKAPTAESVWHPGS